jgi:hypothetical protein
MMTPQKSKTEQTLRTTAEALRSDMKAINRAEELLFRARSLTQRIEERVRRTLSLDDQDGKPPPS